MEREELNILVKQGVRFSITYKVRRRNKGLKGLFQRPQVKTVKEDFEIQEPTLSVLDRLSAIWVEMGLDENQLSAGGMETLAPLSYKQPSHWRHTRNYPSPLSYSFPLNLSHKMNYD